MRLASIIVTVALTALFFATPVFAMGGLDTVAEPVALSASAPAAMTVLPLAGGLIAWLLVLGWVFIPRWAKPSHAYANETQDQC